jgi:hypothetical protein
MLTGTLAQGLDVRQEGFLGHKNLLEISIKDIDLHIRRDLACCNVWMPQSMTMIQLGHRLASVCGG